MSRSHPMSKSTITRLFVGATVAFGVGLALVLVSVWAAFASGLNLTVTLIAVGSLAMAAGTVAAVVSWIGALLNTAKLERTFGIKPRPLRASLIATLERLLGQGKAA